MSRVMVLLSAGLCPSLTEDVLSLLRAQRIDQGVPSFNFVQYL